MNGKLKERIMLAVTYVNGCAMCSFVHTKKALSSGMKDFQITNILSGNYDHIPKEDAVAALFGEHFAATHESPDIEAITRLIDEYGNQKAELIMAACQVITMTNGMGIALDDFYHRLKFKRRKSSKIFIEILNPFMTLTLFIPFVLYFYILSFFVRPVVLKKVSSV
jgi:AhpD family alkylhydroperoxidase